MVYRIRPVGFIPKFEVVSCFVLVGPEFLALRRHPAKPEPNTWGVPAGKVDPGESIEAAIRRELHEKTGSRPPWPPIFRQRLFVRYPEYDFVYHVFQLTLRRKISVVLNPVEHQESRWVSPRDALELALVREMDWVVRDFFGIPQLVPSV